MSDDTPHTLNPGEISSDQKDRERYYVNIVHSEISSYEFVHGTAHAVLHVISQHCNFMLINFMYFIILIS
jgi:hypothetical protein